MRVAGDALKVDGGRSDNPNESASGGHCDKDGPGVVSGNDGRGAEGEDEGLASPRGRGIVSLSLSGRPPRDCRELLVARPAHRAMVDSFIRRLSHIEGLATNSGVVMRRKRAKVCRELMEVGQKAEATGGRGGWGGNVLICCLR